MPRTTKAQKAKQSATWARYESAMLDLKVASERLLDALKHYLRGGCDPFHGFDWACEAAENYRVACDVAEEYHFASIPRFSSGSVINGDAEDIAKAISAIRGTPVDLVTRYTGKDGLDRVHVGIRYVGGVADWVDVELRSMRAFGTPRRDPEVCGYRNERNRPTKAA